MFRAVIKNAGLEDQSTIFILEICFSYQEIQVSRPNVNSVTQSAVSPRRGLPLHPCVRQGGTGPGSRTEQPVPGCGAPGQGTAWRGQSAELLLCPQRGARWPPATPQSCDRASCAPALSRPRASRRLGVQGAPDPLSLLSCP